MSLRLNSETCKAVGTIRLGNPKHRSLLRQTKPKLRGSTCRDLRPPIPFNQQFTQTELADRTAFKAKVIPLRIGTGEAAAG
eukprot:701070-Amphidinium_carterae.1